MCHVSPAPFVFVQCRPAGVIADDERATIERLGGLREGESLHSLMLFEDPDVDPARDLDLDAYAGVIISGSPYSAVEENEASDPARAHMYARVARLARTLIERDIPTLGLCYGLQMLAVAQGERLIDTVPEDLQAVSVHLGEAAAADPVCRGLAPTIRSFVGHTYALERTPPGATLLGRGEYCTQQLLRWGDNVYGTQFHPEITTAGMKLRIDTYAGHYYNADEARDVIDRCMSQDVTSSNAMISAFVDRYRGYGSVTTPAAV
ncbi:gamma-glutamyl-gamma-aminobutyrate hydrolase family protein [Nanchangia anserum]|uniref:Gamma-glutamyl-gamma-aminobutyrate hydrolase family protein n=1 Tax=Nanchangia anserum TaxID=2692125 RepID=A0A8I0GAY9_9ACTO|nr:gamma-glutamyl-gamma-aminobutyrate hydrolase family protein [Nanchangia anserum]MBD3689458.1 gamma-glutamyl-gamma-aminobutyrate hydrolase family protein [Nanchangia anserum]QOX81657.1 gamma-glutamyl-gamma-aminobutyrate hydrolase family protein [Nanchangia anserum]